MANAHQRRIAKRKHHLALVKAGKARVLDNNDFHGFGIGATVSLFYNDGTNFMEWEGFGIYSEKLSRYWVRDSDLRPVN